MYAGAKPCIVTLGLLVWDHDTQNDNSEARDKATSGDYDAPVHTRQICLYYVYVYIHVYAQALAT